MKISGILLVAAALLLVPAVASAAIAINPGACTTLPNAFTGSLYTATIGTTGCTEAPTGGAGGGVGFGCILFATSPELQAINLTANQAGLGSEGITISGIPSIAGVVNFTLTVTDMYSNTTDTCTGTLTVEVPMSSIPPQYLPPGGYTYNGGATTGTAPGEAYEAQGNSSGTYYAPGGADDGDTGDGNSCFVSSAVGGSLYGACALAALTLCGLFFMRRS